MKTEILGGSNNGSIPSLAGCLPPIGSVIAWMGGNFTNGSNAGFASVLGNTVAAINTAIGPCWRVCDGSQITDTDSPLYGASKYLPNLTDSRFLMGIGDATGAGTLGAGTVSLSSGNLPSHSHGSGTLSAASHDHGGSTQGPSTSLAHEHNYRSYSGGAGSYPNGVAQGSPTGLSLTTSGIVSSSLSHSHGINGSGSLSVSGSTDSTGSGTAFSVVPKYFSVFYIVRIK